MRDINLYKLIVLVFLLSWLGILPSLLVAYGYGIPSYLKFLDLFMGLGPFLAASILSYQTYGKAGLKHLFGKLLKIRASASVFFLAVIIPPLLSMIASYIGFMLSAESWPASYDALSILKNGCMITLMYLLINTEEFAWRGIVFDQLLDKHGFFKACLILGPIWWLFHMPLFLFPGGHPAGYGLVEFSCIVIAITLSIGWIYEKSGRSLFYAHLHHQLLNGFGEAFPIFPTFISFNFYPLWTFCGLLLLLSGILIFFKLKENKSADLDTVN